MFTLDAGRADATIDRAGLGEGTGGLYAVTHEGVAVADTANPVSIRAAGCAFDAQGVAEHPGLLERVATARRAVAAEAATVSAAFGGVTVIAGVVHALITRRALNVGDAATENARAWCPVAVVVRIADGGRTVRTEQGHMGADTNLLSLADAKAVSAAFGGITVVGGVVHALIILRTWVGRDATARDARAWSPVAVIMGIAANVRAIRA